MSFNGNSLENSFPEKIIVVIKSYLAILQDYEIGDKPLFPVDDNNFFEQQKVKTGDFLYIARIVLTWQAMMKFVERLHYY